MRTTSTCKCLLEDIHTLRDPDSLPTPHSLTTPPTKKAGVHYTHACLWEPPPLRATCGANEARQSGTVRSATFRTFLAYSPTNSQPAFRSSSPGGWPAMLPRSLWGPRRACHRGLLFRGKWNPQAKQMLTQILAWWAPTLGAKTRRAANLIFASACGLLGLPAAFGSGLCPNPPLCWPMPSRSQTPPPP